MVPIQITGVATVLPDEYADVRNEGTATAPKLVFYIPRGEQGEPGKDGENAVVIIDELPAPVEEYSHGIYKCGDKYYVCKGREAGWENIPVGVSLKDTEIKIGDVVDDGKSMSASRTAFITAWTNGDYQAEGAESFSIFSYSADYVRISETGKSTRAAYPGEIITITKPLVVTKIYAYDVNYSQIFYKPISGITYEWVEMFGGEAAQVSVGTVASGEPGSNAVVTNSGTPYAAILNFTIPKGEKGDTGEPGTNGQDGADGVDGKPFTYEDFTPEQLEALRGPEGIQGPPGENGQDGKDGADYILTEADKQEIAELVIAQMPEGSILPESEEVSF
jgi:hypothetical protein